MKKVNYRAFVKNPKKFMKDLPIELQMFGKPWAVVASMEGIEKIEDVPEGAPTVPGDQKMKFDWDTGEYCQSCKDWVPKILMQIHSHVVHGL